MQYKAGRGRTCKEQRTAGHNNSSTAIFVACYHPTMAEPELRVNNKDCAAARMA